MTVRLKARRILSLPLAKKHTDIILEMTQHEVIQEWIRSDQGLNPIYMFTWRNREEKRK
jgi:hypothetical protein